LPDPDAGPARRPTAERDPTLARRYARVLVTGGAGFIGSHLVEAFVRLGCETVVIDDLSRGSRANLAAGATLVEADVADPGTVEVIARAEPDLVIHAAAQVSVPTSIADPARDRAVNLVGTAHVLDGARRAGARRFVLVSSGGAVYGEARMATEDQAPAPASPYGVHKLAAEGYVRLSGLSYGIARYANVFGPRQRSDLEGGVVAIFAEALRGGRPLTIFGTGEQTRDLIHVDDVVEATLAIASTETDGTWNVGTGTPTSVQRLLRELEQLIGPAVEVRHAASRPGDVPVSSLSIERIRRELGWSPRLALGDGLRQMLDHAP
jgi:UDP-glucose 4-epimerase